MDVLIVAPATIEASLVARRLQRWGAKSLRGPDEQVAALLLGEREWSAVLVDHALGTAACERLARAAAKIAHRIVLITPAARPELPALKEAGFTGYLVKPVRAVSLAARLGGEHDGFERCTGDGRRGNDRGSAAPTEAALAILVAEDNEINALLTRRVAQAARPSSDRGRRTAKPRWRPGSTPRAAGDALSIWC